MGDNIEKLAAVAQDALRQADEELLYAVDEVAPAMMKKVGPGSPPLRPRPTIADYEQDLALLSQPGHDSFGHLRDLMLIGIRVGTISVEDVYRRVRPATVALTLLLDPGVGEAAQDLVRRIRRGAGRGAEHWAEAVVAVDAWPGSLRSLLRREAYAGGDLSVPGLVALADHLWRGANILLALAPPGTLDHTAAGAAPMGATGRVVGEPQAVRYARALTRLAGHAPVTRTVVDHAMDPETSPRVRMALAANPLTPNDVLIRLLTFADREPGIAAAICLHECAPPAVRLAAFGKVSDPEVLARARAPLQRDIDLVRRIQRIATLAADEAHLVHALIRDAGPDLPMAGRLFAYAQLARVSGVEAVWALELERAGSLAAMHPAVRASMETGSAVPLLEAAVADPYRGVHQDTVTSAAALRREEAPDWPFPWQDSDGGGPDQPGCDAADFA
jgi:hypothetical protein